MTTILYYDSILNQRILYQAKVLERKFPKNVSQVVSAQYLVSSKIPLNCMNANAECMCKTTQTSTSALCTIGHEEILAAAMKSTCPSLFFVINAFGFRNDEQLQLQKQF